MVKAPVRISPRQVQQVTPGQVTSASLTSALLKYRAHLVSPAAENEWGAHRFLQHETSKYIKPAQFVPSSTIPNTEQVSKFNRGKYFQDKSGIYKYFLIFISCTFFARAKESGSGKS